MFPAPRSEAAGPLCSKPLPEWPLFEGFAETWIEAAFLLVRPTPEADGAISHESYREGVGVFSNPATAARTRRGLSLRDLPHTPANCIKDLVLLLRRRRPLCARTVEEDHFSAQRGLAFFLQLPEREFCYAEAGLLG